MVFNLSPSFRNFGKSLRVKDNGRGFFFTIHPKPTNTLGFSCRRVFKLYYTFPCLTTETVGYLSKFMGSLLTAFVNLRE